MSPRGCGPWIVIIQGERPHATSCGGGCGRSSCAAGLARGGASRGGTLLFLGAAAVTRSCWRSRILPESTGYKMTGPLDVSVCSDRAAGVLPATARPPLPNTIVRPRSLRRSMRRRGSDLALEPRATDQVPTSSRWHAAGVLSMIDLVSSEIA